MNIHPTAIIDKEVELASDVTVGPFAVIRGRVRIQKGTKIDNHVSIGNPYGLIEIGEENHILAGAVIGGPPQDLSYKGDVTKLIIGNKNIIREFATINCGTIKGGGITRIGNECMLMAYVHVAHDCQFGNNVIVANSTQFAGHVEVSDFARIGGMTGVAQFIRIGRYAYVGGGSDVNKDIIPFSIAEGRWAVSRATNKIGLTRAGFKKEDIDGIYKAVRILLKAGLTIDESIKKIQAEVPMSEHVEYLIQFVKSSDGGIGR